MPAEFLIPAAVLFGLVVGSFLNVVIHRLPIMMERDWQHQAECHIAQLSGIPMPAEPVRYTLSVPRSACPRCGHPITALENIPVLSYLWLGGKCAACKTPISLRYPLVETCAAALAALMVWKFGANLAALAAFSLAASLLTLTLIDIDTQLLPDSITLPLLWAGLLFNLAGGFTDLPSAVIGAAAGYLLLWSVYWLFKLATGKEGMGYGDFKLLAAIGAWFGWKLLPAVILISSVAGTIVGIGLIVLARRGRDVPIPFGPYLALGGLAALFFGTPLTRFFGV